MSAPVRLGLRPVLDTSRSLFYAHLTLVHLEDGSDRLTGAVEKDDGARKLHAIELGCGQAGRRMPSATAPSV